MSSISSTPSGTSGGSSSSNDSTYSGENSSTSSNSLTSDTSSTLSSPTTSEQLASQPTTTESLAAQPTTADKLSTDQQIDNNGNIAGTVTSTVTGAIGGHAADAKQQVIGDAVQEVADRLKATGDPAQIAQAEALIDANKADGLTSKINPDKMDYDIPKALDARNAILSDSSVLGNKLSNQLSRMAPHVDKLDGIASKAGVVGLVAGPAIGAITENAKLPEDATVADHITASITGGLKTVDNAVVGAGAGFTAGALTSFTGPGAVAVGVGAGIAADQAYSATSLDRKFGELVDQAQPYIHSTVETAIDLAEEAQPYVEAGIELADDAIDSVQNFASQQVDNISDAAESAKEAIGRFF